MKYSIFLPVMTVICAVLFIGCSKNGQATDASVDYSKYSFVNVSWSREGDHDFETIRFNDDGSFSYSCSCGNPVNDSDLCEGYTYDDGTKIITLDCVELTDEMVTEIEIVMCSENELQLDFDGDVRTFVKE